MVITDTPGKTFDKIAMDIVGSFNITKKNNKYILSIQDQLSKFIILVLWVKIEINTFRHIKCGIQLEGQ